jgi:succinyldiaminopimelate transaminase
LSARLPDFPWDTIAAEAALARQHPDGIVDLSVGTPVDPVPGVVQEALRAASDSPGYPTTIGTPALREAAASWLQRRLGVPDVDPATEVIPTIGSKELVAWLPTFLGIGPGEVVVVPEVAYPTYAVGGLLVGAQVVASDSLTALGPTTPRLVWVNSPSNPTGRVLPAEHLAKVVAWARERGVVVASDECYAELPWTATPVSILHPSVCGGSFEGLLAVHSLSKRSNLAGYRAGLVVGDAALVGALLEVRKHLGMLMPTPIQAAATAALGDDAHVVAQRETYGRRRTALLAAVTSAGFRVDFSEAGLYLWATRDEPGRETLRWFAERGILVAPGDFYGAAGATYVRIALTAADDRIAAAVSRLSRHPGERHA